MQVNSGQDVLEAVPQNENTFGVDWHNCGIVAFAPSAFKCQL